MRYYGLGGCSALVVCAQRSQQVRGDGASAGSRVSPLPPPLPPRSSRCLRRVVLSRFPLPLPAGTPFHTFMGRPSGPRRVPVGCVCAPAPAAFAPPPPGLLWRAQHARFCGRELVGPFQVVPAPPRFLFRSSAPPSYLGRGLARSLLPLASLWVACPLAGWPVRPGRSGARGAWGRWGRLPPPFGAWLCPGQSGGLGGLGAGGRSASVRPSASLVRAPRRASVALLSPPRVRSPYCAGSFPRAPVRAPPGGGVVGRPGVSASGWRAGWQAGRLPRSLVGGGRVTVWGRAARGPSGAPGAALGPGRRGHLGEEGGGASPVLAGGYRADVPRPVTSTPRPGGGGGERVAPG